MNFCKNLVDGVVLRVKTLKMILKIRKQNKMAINAVNKLKTRNLKKLLTKFSQ